MVTIINFLTIKACLVSNERARQRLLTVIKQAEKNTFYVINVKHLFLNTQTLPFITLFSTIFSDNTQLLPIAVVNLYSLMISIDILIRDLPFDFCFSIILFISSPTFSRLSFDFSHLQAFLF